MTRPGFIATSSPVTTLPSVSTMRIGSAGLGLVELDQAKVASMTRLDSGEKAVTPAPSAPPASKERTAAVQNAITTDPESLAQLAKLKESPLMQEILSDPDLMAKVAAGDMAALAQDPRIQKLLEDPSVHSIRKRVE
jgi:hypothetical protein